MRQGLLFLGLVSVRLVVINVLFWGLVDVWRCDNLLLCQGIHHIVLEGASSVIPEVGVASLEGPGSRIVVNISAEVHNLLAEIRLVFVLWNLVLEGGGLPQEVHKLKGLAHHADHGVLDDVPLFRSGGVAVGGLVGHCVQDGVMIYLLQPGILQISIYHQPIPPELGGVEDGELKLKFEFELDEVGVGAEWDSELFSKQKVEILDRIIGCQNFNLSNSILNMTWYFDFCMYYLPNDPVLNTNRYLTFAGLFIQVLLYSLVQLLVSSVQQNPPPPNRKGTPNTESTLNRRHQMDDIDNLDKLEESTQKDKSDGTPEHKSEEEKRSESDDSTFGMFKSSFQRPRGCCSKWRMLLTQFNIKEFDKQFSTYFGHHAVAIGMCTLYVPHYPFTLISIGYLLLGIVTFFFFAFKFERVVTGLWSVILIINVVLFFSATSNIGMMNYDPNNNMCYGQETFTE